MCSRSLTRVLRALSEPLQPDQQRRGWRSPAGEALAVGWQLKEEQEGGPGLLQPSGAPCEGVTGGLCGSWGLVQGPSLHGFCLLQLIELSLT